jgi:hypothetical protein
MAKKKSNAVDTVFGERIVPPHENAEAYAKFHKRACEHFKPRDFIDEIRAQIFVDQNWHYAQSETLRNQLFTKLQGWQNDLNPLIEFGAVMSRVETVDRIARDALKISNDIYAAIEQRRELFADRQSHNGEEVEAPTRAKDPSNDNVKAAAVSTPAGPEEPEKIADPEVPQAADEQDESCTENSSDITETSASEEDSVEAESEIDNQSDGSAESAEQDVQEAADDAEESAEPEVEQNAYEPDDLEEAQSEEAADVTEPAAEQPEEDAA